MKIKIERIDLCSSHVLKVPRHTMYLTLKLTSAQVVETSFSVNNNRSFQNYTLTRTITLDKLLVLLGSNHLPCCDVVNLAIRLLCHRFKKD